MTAPDPLRTLYKSLSGKGALPLKPDDPYYVPILEKNPEKDPILALWQRIDLADSESINLLTGFRGNGKSTELQRLKKKLEESGCQVFLVDMLEYVLMTKPLALSDFILSLMAALAGSVEKSEQTALAPLSRSYWERLCKFLSTEVALEKIDLDIGDGAAKLGFKLKTDPDFKTLIQKHLDGHLTRLVQDAREFVDGLVKEIRIISKDPDKKVVLIVDSLEQLRGVGQEAETIYASVRELFFGQSNNLSFPKLHVVYTVPPYLTVLVPNLGRTLGGNPVTQWPNIHVRKRETGKADPDGINIMRQVVYKRFDTWEAFISKDQLAHLAVSSGGDLRDYFRLVRETALSLRTVRFSDPSASLDDSIIERVIQQLKNELLPIPEEDAVWLSRIHESKQTSLMKISDVPDLARFLDTNRIMNYMNGEPWFDVHPLILDEIREKKNTEK